MEVRKNNPARAKKRVLWLRSVNLPVKQARSRISECPMKSLKMIILLFVLVPAFAVMQAKTKKPHKLPAMFNQAQYVYVEAVDGQQFDPRLIPEDRQAIADVQSALDNWKRYTLVVRRDEADLIFVVRKGRLAQADVGVLVSSGPLGSPRPAGPGPSRGVAAGGEVGPPDDLLEVYQRNPNDAHGTLLWQRTRADGLDTPDLTLFKQLKDQVDHDYPPQTASNPKKP
jgi:hypothetical protein